MKSFPQWAGTMREPQASAPVKAEPSDNAGESGPSTGEEVNPAGITSERQQVRGAGRVALQASTRIAIAVGAAWAAFLLRQAMQKYLGHALPPFLTFYPAVMLVAMLVGMWPGLLATALAALLAAHWLNAPAGMAMERPADAASIVFFAVMGAFMSVVAELYRRNRRKAAEYEQREALRASEDLNQRMAAEAGLRHLAAIVESSEDAIYAKDLEGRIVSWNRGAEKIFGYTAREMIGQPVTLLIAPGQDNEVEQILARIRRGEAVEHLETVRLRKDRTRRDVSITVSPIHGPDKRITGASSVARDITDRKQAEERLRKASDYTRTLLEASLDPLVTISREGKITDVNRATELATGVARDRLIGSDFSDYFTDPGKAREGYQQVFSQGAVQDYPLSIRHASGRITDVLYNATVFRGDAGEIEGVFAAARDVTRQKQAESEAQRYMQELERSNAELQDFASIASHDLQEPLRKVMAFGEHLREHSGDKLDELGRDFLQRMQNAAQRMSGLIEALLQYSRVATRTQPPQPVDMLAVIFGVVADMGERIAQSHARIELSPVPKVMADPTQVRQLLQNLVANALKFQRPGSQPHVEIEGRVRDGGRCEISVRDNGIGFDEKYLDRIFRPFQRLHGRSEYEGSGMGLAICRKVVARHGGTITAHSRPGEGSTFVLTLPAAPDVPVEFQEGREPWGTEKAASSSESCSPKTMTTISS